LSTAHGGRRDYVDNMGLADLRTTTFGWSQRQLARRAQINHAQISRFEAGLRPSPAATDKIVAAFLEEAKPESRDLVEAYIRKQLGG
jgi:transcriptional regulator with XRE-family HTH domain